MSENENTCGKSSCEGCESTGNCDKSPASFLEELNSASKIGKVIGVASGKGGVGKSFVTGSLAAAFTKAGYKVGIMDADITGPSIPKMYGIHGPAVGSEDGVVPIPAKDGTKIMSINLLVQDEEAPVIWRGPVIAGTVKQFWTDVVWGELDYLFVDMPPGTGDVPLTVFQSIPLDGLVVVTSPQDLVSLIVKKCYNMATMMNIPILGIVENYSYMLCPHCKEKISVFGKSDVDNAAAMAGTTVIGRLPINPEYAKACDEGEFTSLKVDGLEAAVEKIRGL